MQEIRAINMRKEIFFMKTKCHLTNSRGLQWTAFVVLCLALAGIVYDSNFIGLLVLLANLILGLIFLILIREKKSP